jgi:general L-amino acid transport system substrate-binding protein
MKVVARVFAAACSLAALSAVPAHAGATLDAIKARGVVHCGVNTGVPGLSFPDSTGRWRGLDVDFCRGVAAALFGDAEKVKYVPLSSQTRFTALQSGEVDLLSRNTTWTLSRDMTLGINFATVTYYDGQGFMVPKKSGIKSARDLSGATVCVLPGSTTELNLADYFRSNRMELKPLVIDQLDQLTAAYFAGRCDAYTTDASQLAGIRSSLAGNPDDHLILPEIISKEPLGPAVRNGDDEWFDLVKWVVYATIEAEEKGVTSRNIDGMLKSEDPTIKRLLGVTPPAKGTGLDDRWAYNVIKQVGNYGEIFERNLGKNTPLKLERGINDLWTKGGLMYAMPFR